MGMMFIYSFNVHANMKDMNLQEHPLLCKYLMSLLQGKIPLRHMPGNNIRKTYFSLKLELQSLLGKKIR